LDVGCLYTNKHHASYQTRHEKVRKNLSSGNRDIYYRVPQALEYQPSITVIMMGTTSSGISTLRVSHLLLIFCVVLLRVITF
jgi:hypothetical protein